MPSHNHLTLMGNLTRDPDITYTPKGTAIANIGLAINRHYTIDSGEKREEVTFVDVTLWGRVAEIVGEYCKKGAPLFVEGRLQLDTWDDKQTGEKRYKLKVIGENIQLLGQRERAPSKAEQEQADASSARKRPEAGQGQPQGAGGPPVRRPADPDGDGEDDIPFRSILIIARQLWSAIARYAKRMFQMPRSQKPERVLCSS